MTDDEAFDYRQINFGRLDDALTYAVDHPEEFDFSSWFAKTSCGTTACVAGTVVYQAGWTPVWFDRNTFELAEDVVKDGDRRYTPDLAAELLGLDENLADRLFVYAGSLCNAIDLRNKWARCAGVPERTWDVPAVLQ